MKTIKLEDKNITPSKVICVGRNYVDHIKELGNELPSSMVIFNKPNSAISDTLYFFQEDTRFEGEICFLIKDNKIDAIAIGLDLTHANLQNQLKSKALPWERSKCFDGSAVFSQFVPFNEDITKLKMELFLNDKLIQLASYDLMIYKPQEMIDEIQSFMSFEDGDIIMSGTPKGVGTYSLGDTFEGKLYCEDKLIVQNSWSVSSLSN